MRQLIRLIKKYRAFLSFVLLELFCFWLIATNTIYQSSAFFNSSNTLVASVFKVTNDVSEFVRLKKMNERLLSENAALRYELEQLRQLQHYNPDKKAPDIVVKRYHYTPARVESNSIRMFNNYLTINKGRKSGIRPGMAVIGDDGVVGIVKSCSDNFSTVISALHSEIKISSAIKGKGTLCTTTWDGASYTSAILKYIPRHISLQKGDTVVTSGYNSVFPEGVPIGIIEDFSIKDENPFYNGRIRLTTDFSNLSYVYVITNHLKQEKRKLEEEND